MPKYIVFCKLTRVYSLLNDTKKKTINTDVIYILPFGIGDTVGRVALRGDESEAEPCYRLECNT